MLPLPHGRILLFIGWVLIAAIVIGSLAPHAIAGLGIAKAASIPGLFHPDVMAPGSTHAIDTPCSPLHSCHGGVELLQGLRRLRANDPGDFA
jgi:hypothetical protein